MPPYEPLAHDDPEPFRSTAPPSPMRPLQSILTRRWDAVKRAFREPGELLVATAWIVLGVFLFGLVILVFGSIAMSEDAATVKNRQAAEEADRVKGYLRPVLEQLDRIEKLEGLAEIADRLGRIEARLKEL